jgi:hypothetical protein
MCNLKFQQWALAFVDIDKLQLNHKILERKLPSTWVSIK